MYTHSQITQQTVETGKFALCLANKALKPLPRPREAHRCGEVGGGSVEIEIPWHGEHHTYQLRVVRSEAARLRLKFTVLAVIIASILLGGEVGGGSVEIEIGLSRAMLVMR